MKQFEVTVGEDTPAVAIDFMDEEGFNRVDEELLQKEEPTHEKSPHGMYMGLVPEDVADLFCKMLEYWVCKVNYIHIDEEEEKK